MPDTERARIARMLGVDEADIDRIASRGTVDRMPDIERTYGNHWFESGHDCHYEPDADGDLACRVCGRYADDEDEDEDEDADAR